MDAEPAEPVEEPVEAALGPVRLPEAPPLSSQEISQISQGILSRVIRFTTSLAEPIATKQSKAGLNRLAASNLDQSAWITLITRLASRASAVLEDSDGEENVKVEDGMDESTTIMRMGFDSGRHSLGQTIRDSLYLYVLEDWRKRIDTAVAWLNEEWYNDRIQQKQDEATAGHYRVLAIKVLDGLLPYLDARDKIFTRFMSELPEITEPMLARVKSLAKDPERVNLAVTTLQ